MRYAERESIVQALSYESRLGYIAFCVERCLAEARRHPAAKQQLDQLPDLSEGVEMLWARAERGVSPDPARVDAIRAHLQTYDRPAADRESVEYDRDVILVQAARMLAKGMTVLQQSPSEVDPDYVAGALEWATQSVGVVYADWKAARAGELGVIDDALLRLKKRGSKPFSRSVFDGIPEWKRGELSKKYAEGRLTGSAVDDDD